uniref:Arginyl-tRNA--protein transferase n=1 Tax=Cajanus cajan TaxID=3821 RepID=A0A151U946_CAJCA|nr:Arginyl-tRNA--protein transferase 1 [Cajanus cajan]
MASSSRSNNPMESVVVECGRRRASCGYCRSSLHNSISHGMWAHSLTVDDYQDLLDRGWRRSGCFLYKPEMERTCCPSYTIRLKATHFLPTKDQLRVSRRMQRFLDGTLGGPNTSTKSENSSRSMSEESLPAANEEVDQVQNSINVCEKENESSHKIIAEKLVASLDSTVKNYGLSIRACNGHINFYASSEQISPSRGDQNVPVPNNSRMKHDTGGNRLLRSEHCQVKRRKLEIRLNRSSFDPEEFALYRKYQLKVHNDKPHNVTENSYRRFLVDTPLLEVSPTGDNTVPPCGFGSFHQQYLIDGQLVAVGVIDILPNCLSSKYLFWDPDFAFLSLGKYSAIQEIGWVKENQVYCPSLQYYYLGYYIHSCNKMRYKAAYRPSELLCPLRYQWVPFDIARPLLDRKPYVVLSDFSNLENVESSLPQITDDVMGRELDDVGQEDANDVPMLEDEEMVESESEFSDDEPDLETTSYDDPEIGDVSKVLLGIKGSRVKYEDLRNVFAPKQRSYFESQLRRYRRVVGTVLSERMVYSIG